MNDVRMRNHESAVPNDASEGWRDDENPADGGINRRWCQDTNGRLPQPFELKIDAFVLGKNNNA